MILLVYKTGYMYTEILLLRLHTSTETLNTKIFGQGAYFTLAVWEPWKHWCIDPRVLMLWIRLSGFTAQGFRLGFRVWS